MHRKHPAILLLIALVMAFATSAIRAQDEPLRVVATTTQAADLVHILTDGIPEGAVEVTALMGPGVDPHLYQPVDSDINAMEAADIVIYSGLHLEGKFDEVFEALGQTTTRVIAMSQPVKDAGFIIGGFDLSEELQNVDDPHYWFDPRNWQMTVEEVADVLAESDPDNADVYLANAEAYIADLDTLYNWALEAMSTVPEGQRVLVTSHDAFQYFGEAFGWQVRGLQGLSTADEASVADVQDIAQYVIDNEIPVMFVESSVPPDAIEAVQESVNAGGGAVSIGIRELYSDAMGEPDTFGGTYIGMIAENVYTILQSYQLQGVELEIPEWPEDLEPQPEAELFDIEAVD